MFHDERAMTGLEAAIVLIAFVVVASVFACIVIGSGLFVSQKSREVVNSAVDQVSSTILVAGHVSGTTDFALSPRGNTLITINLPLKVSPFSSPVDISKTVVCLITTQTINNSVFFPLQGETVSWISTRQTPPDMMLESGEIVIISMRDLDIPSSTTFILQVMTPGSQTLSLSLTAPSQYEAVMSIGHGVH